MADDTKKGDEGAGQIPPQEPPKMVTVPLADITKIQADLAALEKGRADDAAKMAGLEEMLAKGNDAPAGTGKLREKASFEPQFRTVRVRKYPIANDITNLGWVIGFSNRGAYQEVDRSGIAPQFVDYIDVQFLGHERSPEGKLLFEKIKLLDYLNKGEQVHCKVLDVKVNPRKVPTGEEINVTMWDPQHGLVATGDTIDGWVGFTDRVYTIEIPGHGPTEIDDKYLNN